jgi:hypothetical protein
MARSKRDPFEIKLKGKDGETSEQATEKFTEWLCRTLTTAESARSALTSNLPTWHALYEQAPRTRTNAWPDAADLASYIPTEKVDALRARLVQAVFGAEPICVVEGWGDAASRAPKVEEFHQWKAEDERLQTFVARTLHNALIEGNGLLEIDEKIDVTSTVTEMECAVECDEWHRPILGEDGQMTPKRDEHGDVVPATSNEIALKAKVKDVNRYPCGPQYRVLKLEDFLYLPGHAEQMSDVYGFAVRVHMRLGDLKRLEKDGRYKHVDQLSGAGGRDEGLVSGNTDITVEQGYDDYVEHELWRVHLRYDVDGDGVDEWTVATVSRKQRVLLRWQFDDLKQMRVVSFVPFPRPNSVYGYSYVGHKLWTLADEHTALRNMAADRSALATNAPILALATSPWDPEDQPWGPRAVIRLNDLNEIKQMQVSDVPNSVLERERNILEAAERVSGQNDVAVSGVSSQQSRTATEVNAVSQASFVRVDEAVKHVQEALEDVYQLRHTLYQRQLKAKDDGLEPPDRVIKGLERRGITMPNTGAFAFTAEDLDGSFKFKPRGSVESSDPVAQRNALTSMMNALPALFAAFPTLQQQMAMNPKAGEAMLEWLLQSHKVPDRQAFRAVQAQQDQTSAMVPGQPGGMHPEMAGALESIKASMGMGAPQPDPMMGAEGVAAV